ncbi:MAG: DUF805 domain-containing protein [Marinirhabdus sp.]|nr:DUF805 domain-containing protein [Marinirhabdus sp.]
MTVSKKPESQYTMVDWWKKVVIDNYANFDGRARRSEYWYFSLLNILITVVFGFILVVMGALSDRAGEPPVTFYLVLMVLALAYLMLLLPSIAVAVRRLHDTDKSGWWYLLGVIPIINYVGGIVLLIFYCTEGTRGANQYGKDPKEQSGELFL